MKTNANSFKIGIVIPMFNASAHIEECLDHVFASDFKEFEVVLIDDNSTDDSLKKASRYPCRVIRNETNKGAAASRNYGGDASRGDIILFVDITSFTGLPMVTIGLHLRANPDL